MISIEFEEYSISYDGKKYIEGKEGWSEDIPKEKYLVESIEIVVMI